MCGVFRRWLGLAKTLLVRAFLLLIVAVFNVNSVLALSQSSASIVVTAVVAPVRYVLVNQNNDIIEILSNTPLNVSPKVYQASFKSNEIPLTALIDNRYQDIIARINTSRAGVIYSRQANQPASLISMKSLRDLSKIESILFKTKQ